MKEVCLYCWAWPDSKDGGIPYQEVCALDMEFKNHNDTCDKFRKKVTNGNTGRQLNARYKIQGVGGSKSCGKK